MSTALDNLPARSNGQAIRPMSDFVDVVQHLSELWDLASILHKSRMIPSTIATPEAAVAIILKGRELGIGPMHAFDSISVIQGKPTISPQLMLALIERSGSLEDMAVEEQPESCTITLKRRGRSPQRVTFDRQEANSMGLWGKGNWLKMPGVMLYWRCVAKACRRVFPDIIAGCYTPDEMGASVGEDGEIIDGEVMAEARPSPKFPDQGSGHGTSGSYASPAQVKASNGTIAAIGKEEAERWTDAWISSGQDFPPGLSEYPFTKAVVAREMLEAAIRQGKLEPIATTNDPETGREVPRASVEQTLQMIAVVHHREPLWFEQTLRGVLGAEKCKVAARFVADNPGFHLPPEYEDFDYDRGPEDDNQDRDPPPPAAPKRMTKKELADQTLAEIRAKAAAAADRGDAFEGVQ